MNKNNFSYRIIHDIRKKISLIFQINKNSIEMKNFKWEIQRFYHEINSMKIGIENTYIIHWSKFLFFGLLL